MSRKTVDQKQQDSENERILGGGNGSRYGSTQRDTSDNRQSAHSSFSDQQKGPISPETNANVFNRWTLWWENGLFRVGFKRQIKEEDLYQMLDRRRAKVLGQLLADHWESEKTQALKQNRTPSLLRALVGSFWNRYLPGFICLELGGMMES